MKYRSTALKQRESARKYAHRRQTGELVRRRAVVGGRYRCEGCGELVDVIQVAHVFGKGGRRAGVPEVWASTPELCAALCCAESWGDRLGCHERHDRNLDAELSAQIEWEALDRLLERYFGDEWPFAAVDLSDDPLDAIRALIRHADADGIEP